jgi:hypothetical protein
LKLDTKIDHHSKFLKFSKMAANIKIQKIVKNSKMKRFNGNGYLQGVRHATPYCNHFGLLWLPF